MEEPNLLPKITVEKTYGVSIFFFLKNNFNLKYNTYGFSFKSMGENHVNQNLLIESPNLTNLNIFQLGLNIE